MSILALSGLSGSTTAMLLLILGLSAMVSGLSGFGFSAIGAICLWLLPPTLAVPLLMALSSANQMMSLGQIRADMKPFRQWWPDGPGPFIVGGFVGVPIGLWLLHSLPTPVLMVIFGASLVAYAAYSIATPANGHALSGSWPISVLVGMAGGIIGGFTAFPGAAVVVWIGRRGFAKAESRAIVQPYIFAMQLVSLAMLAVQHPSTFNSGFWSLFAINIVVVLPGTLLGVYIYKSLSDVNFRRVSFSLLGTSGVAIFTKGVGGLSIATGLLSTMTH